METNTNFENNQSAEVHSDEINRQARETQDALDRAARDAEKSKWNPKNWF
jgi:hypothetical protein